MTVKVAVPAASLTLTSLITSDGVGSLSVIVVVTLLAAGLAAIASKPPPLMPPSDTTTVSSASSITSLVVGSVKVALVAPAGIVTLTTPV